MPTKIMSVGASPNAWNDQGEVVEYMLGGEYTDTEFDDIDDWLSDSDSPLERVDVTLFGQLPGGEYRSYRDVEGYLHVIALVEDNEGEPDP